MIRVGAVACGESWVSDIERALLDAAKRPSLVGGASVLAEAVVAAADSVDTAKLTHYAQALGWASAIRRIGSIADALDVPKLAGQLHPLSRLTADLDLEPGTSEAYAWRDSRWRIRWPLSLDEIRAVARQ